MYLELRAEIGDLAKVIHQLMVLKAIFLFAALGVIIVSLGQDSLKWMGLLPATFAFFFDLVIVGRGFAAKRLGGYLHAHIEPILKETANWAEHEILWEDYVSTGKHSQAYTSTADLMFSFLIGMLSIAIVLSSESLLVSLPISLVILALMIGSVLIIDAAARKAGYSSFIGGLMRKFGLMS